jgi:hypothetical protein
MSKDKRINKEIKTQRVSQNKSFFIKQRKIMTYFYTKSNQYTGI